jgi:hypothetical protein
VGAAPATLLLLLPTLLLLLLPLLLLPSIAVDGGPPIDLSSQS